LTNGKKATKEGEETKWKIFRGSGFEEIDVEGNEVRTAYEIGGEYAE
jgi:hypothetical protein